jgi:HAD superfamily hydrolase (TIGR01549 family)
LQGLLHQDDVQQALDFAASLDYREFIPYMEPEDHLEEILRILQPNYPLAIATNRGQSILPILEHFKLKDFFSVVVTSHDVERPKPAPDMLFLVAEKLQIAPDNCLFIGDSELDQRAAVDAGVQFAGYGEMVAGDISLRNHLDLLKYLSGSL